MAASYPSSAKSFSAKSTTDVVEAAHINDIQDEVTAMQTDLLTAFPGGGADGGQMKFPATRNASSDANTLDDYEEGSFTGTLTGVSGTVTATVKYTAIGNVITVQVPALTGTSNATSKTITGMPAAIAPASAKVFAVFASDNGGAYAAGLGSLASSGTFELYPTAAAGNWTGSGTASLQPFQLTYTLA